MTLSSWVPACAMQIDRPSAVQATPQGLAARDRRRPSRTVLSNFFRATSMIDSALVFIQPRSNCVVGIW